MSQYPSSRVKLVSNMIKDIMKEYIQMNCNNFIISNLMIDLIICGIEHNSLVVLFVTLLTNPILSNIKNESTVKRPNSSTKRPRPISPATLPKLTKFHYI